MKTIAGTVTISLKDYEDLKIEVIKTLELRKKFQEVSYELEVFLSYLCTRYGMDEHIEKYNIQSTKAKILINDGKAKIEIRKLKK
tara:strand:+ start:2594 stop:2848 length:255 start_codon:yes stop_codon:yes gene_type:complete